MTTQKITQFDNRTNRSLIKYKDTKVLKEKKKERKERKDKLK